MSWFLQIIGILSLLVGMASMYGSKEDKNSSVYKFGCYALIIGIILFAYFLFSDSN